MKKIILPTTLAGMALIFGGCPSQQAWLASKPPQFVQGYEEGCRSAERYWENNLRDYKIIDPTLRNDPRYREGWQYGYDRCYAEKESEIWMTQR